MAPMPLLDSSTFPCVFTSIVSRLISHLFLHVNLLERVRYNDQYFCTSSLPTIDHIFRGDDDGTMWYLIDIASVGLGESFIFLSVIRVYKNVHPFLKSLKKYRENCDSKLTHEGLISVSLTIFIEKIDIFVPFHFDMTIYFMLSVVNQEVRSNRMFERHCLHMGISWFTFGTHY